MNFYSTVYSIFLTAIAAVTFSSCGAGISDDNIKFFGSDSKTTTSKRNRQKKSPEYQEQGDQLSSNESSTSSAPPADEAEFVSPENITGIYLAINSNCSVKSAGENNELISCPLDAYFTEKSDAEDRIAAKSLRHVAVLSSDGSAMNLSELDVSEKEIRFRAKSRDSTGKGKVTAIESMLVEIHSKKAGRESEVIKVRFSNLKIDRQENSDEHHGHACLVTDSEADDECEDSHESSKGKNSRPSPSESDDGADEAESFRSKR